ncbi:MAG TPA: cellobiose phosphorylase, partial [Methylomirabilota bacterium]|nr:cellobiose phosphorylase [Methylomirabilota bacterium]
MTPAPARRTPRDADLGLRQIGNASGLSVSLLPNGCPFSIEHQRDRDRIMLNQVLGSPVDGGIFRLYLRVGGARPFIAQAVGPRARVRCGAAADRFVWDGETDGVSHRVTLWLHPQTNLWLWHVEVTNRRDLDLPCDAILVQDIGLGGRGFLMNNEAYVSQYIDHHIAEHARCGPVIMSRQNQAQGGRYPWIVHGCLDGTAGFATDAMQIFGPAYRDAAEIDHAFGVDLPSRRLQHEVACAALQSKATVLKPGATLAQRFFGLYDPDHPEASSDSDLAKVDAVQNAIRDFAPRQVELHQPARS